MPDASSFTAGQITFITRFAADTGMDAGVIAAWLYAEENGSAAQSRQDAHNFDWLNIGYTDSATLGAANSVWGDPTSAADASARWMKGTWTDPGFGTASSGIQHIITTAGQSAAAQISAIQNSGWATSRYPDLPGIYASIDPSFARKLQDGVITDGGVAGLGGTGTTPNVKAGSGSFSVSDSSNPSQDYWTASNNWAQQAYWYFFSDGELLYCADGYEIMAQPPAIIVYHFSPNLVHADFVYDNTAYQFASNHKRKGRVQRKSKLAKVTSPVMGNVQYICDIDAVRAGDVAQVVGFGQAIDGPWLVGNCVRSLFQLSSQLTLVPPLTPQLAGGASQGAAVKSGTSASKPGAGTVIAGLISAASTINNQKLPYVYAGGRPVTGVPTIGSPGPGYDGHTKGFDCSGAVAAVLHGGGLWGASFDTNDSGIIQQLLSQHLIVPGEGSGNPECTLYDSPGVHIFMRLNGEYFGTSDGEGGPNNPGKGGGGGGGGTWLTWGPDVNTFDKYHVPSSVLGGPVTKA